MAGPDPKPEPMKEPLYKDKLVEGLHEYVIQDLSALAGRPYDTGKFLFSISSFMLVATLSLVTAFKGHYLYCLIAIFPLVVSFQYSFKLTIAVVQRKRGDTREKLEKASGNEIEIQNSIYQEYLKKNNWLAFNIMRWKQCMLAFAFLIIVTVGGATYITNKEDINKDVTLTEQLSAINQSINTVAREIAQLSAKLKHPQAGHSDADLKKAFSEVSSQIESHHQSMQRAFDTNSDHLDRHLRIVKDEIKRDR
ncbi:hypothetical protein LJ739_18025 [Aestuariibacter halophilus]|uniref:SMODS and SLOG-associating 2TM effector domain-containing protein n=1 Tax=Fluctibacter halophilus TaxID=226011 RepID=A0ABS8GEE6_9ALTE|nr:hypothetical protein [Aestuariibacter halophilus]MCC2618159.1 hypothetical protein [Aestuariibacter halophilus]